MNIFLKTISMSLLLIGIFFFEKQPWFVGKIEVDGNLHQTEILIVGGGSSGTMAGIQAARMGANTMIVEEGPWLGGMLTSAGVSAIDGNYGLHSGLWEEFRQALYQYYGGPDAVSTGWVSKVLYEPSVGQNILRRMVKKEENLQLYFHSSLKKLKKTRKGWIAYFSSEKGNFKIKTKILIDGTELGDVAKMADVEYDIGMDARSDTGEEIAPVRANNIVQDMTYVVILKDFGAGADKTIPKPANYDPKPFLCTCAGKCEEDPGGRTLWDCQKMMEYGKLPNGKYMINWPINGNDYYLNLIEMSKEERAKALEKAKDFTRNYLYYLQTELGFKNLGIAKGEFPTEDGFPLIPYHRESRRIHGKVQFNVNDLARPFEQKEPLYRTGIAVGDYPVDHHHAEYPDQKEIPDLHFYPVPSYTLPLGSLIPEKTKDLIVVEKSISVSNIVNGTTRLQPVTMLIGQAAGVLGALAVKKENKLNDVSVREVQQHLLTSGAYIQPYSDVLPKVSYFKSVQRIGATGIIKGEGKNVGWTNHTYFYPDSLMQASTLKEGLQEINSNISPSFKGDNVFPDEAVLSAMTLANLPHKSGFKIGEKNRIEKIWKKYDFGTLDLKTPVTRAQMAVILDEIANPFSRFPVDLKGRFQKIRSEK